MDVNLLNSLQQNNATTNSSLYEEFMDGQKKIANKTIKDKHFNSAQILKWVSIFIGNGFSLAFGIYFVSQMFSTMPQIFPYQNGVFMAIAVILLVLLEWAKRKIFGSASEQFVKGMKNKALLKDWKLIVLFIFSILLFLVSWKMSSTGMEQLTKTNDGLNVQIDSLKRHASDSLTKDYNAKKLSIEQNVLLVQSQQNNISEAVKFAQRTMTLNESKQFNDLQKTVDESNNKLKGLKVEFENTIKQAENKIEAKFIDTKKDTSSKIWQFTIFIIIIEALIWLGVFYPQWVETASAIEELEKVLGNPNFPIFRDVYLRIIEILYSNVANINNPKDEKAIGETQLVKMTNLNKKQVGEAYNLFTKLGILISTRGRGNSIQMNKIEAINALWKHFGFN